MGCSATRASSSPTSPACRQVPTPHRASLRAQQAGAPRDAGSRSGRNPQRQPRPVVDRATTREPSSTVRLPSPDGRRLARSSRPSRAQRTLRRPARLSGRQHVSPADGSQHESSGVRRQSSRTRRRRAIAICRRSPVPPRLGPHTASDSESFETPDWRNTRKENNVSCRRPARRNERPFTDASTGPRIRMLVIRQPPTFERLTER